VHTEHAYGDTKAAPPTRRRRLRRYAAALLAGVLPAVTLALADPAAAAASRHDSPWADRAVASYEAMQDNLYLGGSGHGLYREALPARTGDNPYSFLWEFREATQATIDMRGLPKGGNRYRGDVAARFKALEQYATDDPTHPGYESYLPPPLGAGGDLYYDDNAVVGLSYVAQYRASHDRTMLAGARSAFATVARAWDTDTSKSCPGGMHWVEADWNTIRAANVTGLAAQLAADLYDLTRDPSYLSWATRAYDWNRGCLRQSAGLYANDIADDGTVNPTLWTYNSGAMIAAATLLYRSTGDSTYLHNAVEDADGALAYWTSQDRLYNQPAIFNAFFFEDLLLLDSVRHDARYVATLRSYAQRVWSENRDPATGLFRFQASNGGAPDPAQPVMTLNQAAVVRLFAMAAWDARQYDRLG
jgi:hypothetical protein